MTKPQEFYATVVKQLDSNRYHVQWSAVTADGALADGEYMIGPGETLLGRWAYADIKEGQYDGDGNYLGWEE